MRHKNIMLSLFAVMAVLTLFFTPLGGMTYMPPGAWWGDMPASEVAIFWQMRVPRILTAFIAGAGLALSGMAFQAMFRNPLATPFTLGVSSGASLGVAIYIRAGLAISIIGINGSSIAAFLGALLALSAVYGLTRIKGGFASATLLLAGVAVSFCASSLILFMQYLADLQNSFEIVRWLMGSLNVTGYRPVLNILPFIVIGSLILLFLSHELNLLMTGEDLAASRGANVSRVKKLIFVAASLMVGGVVAFCGPIGFIGMIVPHICRLLIGSNHRYLMPATFLAGGSFLALCDMLSRSIVTEAEMPVGIITALLGGPFFICLLVRSKTLHL
ncbi:MAG: iron ABC transporter permease [Lentisphaeria bacterium]